MEKFVHLMSSRLTDPLNSDQLSTESLANSRGLLSYASVIVLESLGTPLHFSNGRNCERETVIPCYSQSKLDGNNSSAGPQWVQFG